MRNILLRIEYNGLNYHGWQFQKNITTVQQEIEKAIYKVSKERVRILGASRTDTGVHALDQMANFRSKKTIDIKAYKFGLNQFLPPDIRIKEALDVPFDFNCQKYSIKKEYNYFISFNTCDRAICPNYFWNIYKDIDPVIIQKALDMIVGKHDFSAFKASNCGSKSQTRHIYKAKILKVKNHFWHNQYLYKITIIGNGFLKQMVRNIVGTLVDVGIKKITPKQFKEILISRDRKKAGITAPAQGLFLTKIWLRKVVGC